jgi:predicted PurR-regulated permease PerM
MSGAGATMSGDAATAEHGRRARLRAAAAARGVPLATILVTVAVVVLTYLAGKLAYRLRDVILMIAVAGFLALILNPLVVALQRWRIPRRGWAVAIVTIWTVLVFAGLLAAFGYPLVNGLTHFSQRLPAYVQYAEHGHGSIGQLIRRFHLQAWVTRNAPKLHSLGTTLAKPALTAGKGAAGILATLGTIFALQVLFLLEAPKMRRGLLSLMSPERAAYCARLGSQISQSATGYALGNLLTSLMAGLVVFVTLTLVGVPFPLLWALWVALVDFLPMIGGALAGIPTVVFALGHSLTAGLVTAAAFIAYQQLENHVLNPVVMSRTVNVNPLLVLLAILVGTSIGDWLGGLFGSFVAALLSIPVAGALQVIARELWQSTAWREPPDREPSADPGLPVDAKGGELATGTHLEPGGEEQNACLVLCPDGARARYGHAELSTGGDAELGKDPVEMRTDGARRQEELLTYLAVRHAPTDQTGDLEFLRRQPLGRVADATATRLARGPQLPPGSLAPGNGGQRVEGVPGRTQRCAGLGQPPLAAKPRATGEEQPGVHERPAMKVGLHRRREGGLGFAFVGEQRVSV